MRRLPRSNRQLYFITRDLCPPLWQQHTSFPRTKGAKRDRQKRPTKRHHRRRRRRPLCQSNSKTNFHIRITRQHHNREQRKGRTRKNKARRGPINFRQPTHNVRPRATSTLFRPTLLCPRQHIRRRGNKCSEPRRQQNNPSNRIPLTRNNDRHPLGGKWWGAGGSRTSGLSVSSITIHQCLRNANTRQYSPYKGSSNLCRRNQRKARGPERNRTSTGCETYISRKEDKERSKLTAKIRRLPRLIPLSYLLYNSSLQFLP